MASKRKREEVGNTKKRLSNRKKKSLQAVPVKNQYEPLNGSDDELFDFSKKGNEIVLDEHDEPTDGETGESDASVVVVDSDSDVVIESDEETPDQPDQQQDKSDHQEEGQTNELSQNNDFIGFGFESSEGENEVYQSDDGVISNDEGKLVSPTPKSLYPWIRAHDHSKQKEIADWLTMEIKDFVNYISPLKDEIVARNMVVSNLKKQIKQCWPNSEAHVFGSFATDLYLPGSDIDMVIISKTGDLENRHKLYQLSSFLRQKKLAKDIEVIAGAKVPIIKFVDPTTNIHIDISFERTNGIDAARRIRRWLETTEGLRELVLVVKQFLRSRKLNNVHVGGLGGYSTIILCYHFLKLHPRVSTNNISALNNLGSLLIEFFELYGRNFSYDNLIIAFERGTDTPKYLKKSYYSMILTSKNPFSIVVQDPDDDMNNITRSSYNLRDIKKAFGGAFQILVDRCYYLHSASYKNRIGQLILGDIIRFKGKERDFNDDRNLVVNSALIQKEQEEDVEIIDEEENVEMAHKYFSDVTVDTEDDIKEPEPKEPTKDSKPKVSEYLSLDSSDDEKPSSLPAKPSIDKNKKRDYWKQKGLI